MKVDYKKILSWVIISIILIGAIIFVFRHFAGEKILTLLWPNGGEELKAGQTYQIQWQSKNIGKVGILLVKGEDLQETKWIVEDISAGNKKYDWDIFVWENTGQDYKIAILEYPWQEGNKTDYSDDFFTILGPQFASCAELSIEEEWPFIPSDLPDQRKVFITAASFTGNLEGLEGGDKKCQEEAEKKEFAGTWKAFLGDDTALAIDRLNLKGIFVEAGSSGDLAEGKTCHRLLGKNFEEFFKKLSAPLLLNQAKFEKTFLAGLANVWLGRVNKESKRDCTVILTEYVPLDPSRGYSFTTTCQNWTTDKRTIPGYPSSADQKKEFPVCYTPQGIRISAVGLAGLASGFISQEETETLNISLAKSCDTSQKLLCIEQ